MSCRRAKGKAAHSISPELIVFSVQQAKHGVDDIAGLFRESHSGQQSLHALHCGPPDPRGYCLAAASCVHQHFSLNICVQMGLRTGLRAFGE